MENPTTSHLSESRLKFLEDTASFYNLGNRAVTSSNRCVYQPTPKSPGCAIGRHCPEEVVQKLDSSCSVRDKRVFEKIPGWLQALGGEFLFEVQRLHDSEMYWTEAGLSESGRFFVNGIKKTYI